MMTPAKSKFYQQIRVIDPISATDTITDVWVEDDVIKEIKPSISAPHHSQILSGEGLILAPCLADIYSRSGEPGYEERETLESLSKTAQAGGFNHSALLPNTDPVMDNPAVVGLIHSRSADFPTRFHCWGALTQGREGKIMAELGALECAGVVGFTDNRPWDNLLLLRRLLEYAHPFNLPVALVPSNLQLRGEGVIREDQNSLALGLEGNPAISETIAIASLMELGALTQTPIHLMRISTARGVELIRKAKEEGLAITASVNWHHLILNSQAVANYNPHLRLEPPLGSEMDRLALVEGVKTGVIDIIAVDHTPYTYEEKTVAFAQAPSGAIGYELILPLLWHNLVMTKQLSPVQLWRALSWKPLEFLRQNITPIQEGKKAEFIIFDPLKEWQVIPSQLQSKSYNTYWLNQKIQGRIKQN